MNGIKGAIHIPPDTQLTLIVSSLQGLLPILHLGV